MAIYSFRARWVLPIDRPPIAGGFVTIEEGRIAEVGQGRPASGPVEELGDVALLPGLVNAHTHLEFSDLAAPLGQPGLSLPEWIRLVISERKRRNHDAAAAIAAGLVESFAAGATTIGEIRTGLLCFNLPADFEVRPKLLAFQESIGFSAQRVDSAFDDLQQRFRRTSAPAGLSPHAPYTVHPKLLDRIVEHANVHKAPVAMHLAESPEELQFLATGDGPFRNLLEDRGMWDGDAIPRGSTPLDYLHRLAATPRSLVIHGNFLTSEDIAFVGARRETMSIVYCPRTHAYFGHAPYPLEAMRTVGVRVALGTDSRASNPDLNLLAELRFAARAFPRIEPAAWVRMATQDGADALGFGDQTGSLTAGKRADLVAISCGAEADPYAELVAGKGDVTRVWIAGRAAWAVSSGTS